MSVDFWFDQIAAHHWLPEGVSGNWSIRRRIVSGDRAEWLRLGMSENDIYSPPGVYTELFEGETRRMSDDVFLLRRDRKFCESAHGRILLTGLGLGLTARWLSMNPAVEYILVIEKSADVIKLVAPYLPPTKIDCLCADAYEFPTADQWDFVLHDCFEERPVNVDLLFANYARHASWQGVSAYGN